MIAKLIFIASLQKLKPYPTSIDVLPSENQVLYEYCTVGVHVSIPPRRKHLMVGGGKVIVDSTIKVVLGCLMY